MTKNIVITLLCVIIIVLALDNYHLRDDKVACSATLVNMASEHYVTLTDECFRD